MRLNRCLFLRAVGIVLLAFLPLTLADAAPEGDSEESARARKILERSGVRGGLVLHLGSDGGRLTAALHAGEGYVVHGLETDRADVEEARGYISSQDKYGPITVEHWNGRELPYTRNLVSLLVVEDPGSLSGQEMMRVLSPRGVAMIKKDGKWTKKVKPWPAEVDEWTHYLQGPDNNAVAQDSRVGPPRHMQWVAGPRWTRHHNWLNSVSSAVTANGRLFYVLDEATPANMKVPGDWVIVARHAFNGVTLWKKPMKSWVNPRHRFRTGPQQAPRLMVASEKYLYTSLSVDGPVYALDSASGDVEKKFAESDGAEELILTGRTLLVLKGEPVAEQAFAYPSIKKKYEFPNEKTLVAVNSRSGKVLWEWSPERRPIPETLAADEKHAYIRVEGGVVCLDLNSGHEQWRYMARGGRRSRRITYGRKSLVIHRDVALLNKDGRLLALSAGSGDKLWSCDAGTAFHAPVEIFGINDLVWQKVSHQMDPMRVPPDRREARELYTGKLVKEDSVARNLMTPGHHFRCYRAKATDRFVVAGKRGVEMMDLDGNRHSRNNWVRGTCQYGVLPANGLLYAPPNSCGCFTEALLHGFWALASDRPALDEQRHLVDEDARLKQGPAYGEIENATGTGAESWPTYRGDALRSGAAATEVPAQLQRRWRAKPGGTLTQPVIAGGYVVFARVDSGMVYALDEKTGEVAWKHFAKGRVDSPPTIYDGKVLFGSAAGWVTCLRLSDGRVAWRFVATPANTRSMAFDRVASPWPVHGSVLVLEGKAYVSAGRSTWLDGGIYLYGLDPATGKVIHRKRLRSRHPEYEERSNVNAVHLKGHLWTDYKTFTQPDHSDSFSMAGGLSDVLVSDGSHVFMRHLMFNKKLDRKTARSRQLFSTFRLLNGTEHHRCDWGIGLGNHDRLPASRHKGGFSRAKLQERDNSPPYRTDSPTGLMLAFNDELVWGVQRRGQDEYRLFEKAMENSRGSYKWTKDVKMRPRALLKSGPNLFLGVMPAKIPEDDPHAAYEGKLGGRLRVYSCGKSAQVMSDYPLDSPVVWDGMAAANGRLYLSTQDGRIICFRAR